MLTVPTSKLAIQVINFKQKEMYWNHKKIHNLSHWSIK